jgi:hypothetical protein
MRGFTLLSSTHVAVTSSPVRGARPMPCDIGGKLLGDPAEDPQAKSEAQKTNQKISER